ncbi:MAG: branched-chain amino acid aminotransferase [Parasphingorhabdus sp.]|jgi:branched-chain amino acid aminotransferase
MNQPSRVAYVNGEFLPENNAKISIRDKGLIYGDGVFDTARTFDGKLFRLEEHIERLFNSLSIAMIDPGISPQDFIDLTLEVVERNKPLLRPGEDYWVSQRVSPGLMPLDGEPPIQQGASIIVDCVPLPLRARAHYFQTGIEAMISSRPRTQPEALSPNIKSNNYLNMMLAQREVQKDHPGAWALMRDVNGNIAEGAGCNFFAVSDGAVITPKVDYVLNGISRRVVIELCEKQGIPFREEDFDADFALRSDEAFFTSTSLCICPVRLLNQREFSAAPGSITAQLMKAFSELVEFDYVGQYLNFLGQGEKGTGI